MQPEDLQEPWKEQGEEVFAAVAQWRAAHPQATLAEIEHASAAAVRLPRGASLAAHGDEQQREHGAVSGRSVG
jgi:hypothetical protein